MISQPRLAAFGIASDRITEKRAFVRRALLLNCFEVDTTASRITYRIGRCGFDPQIEMRQHRKVGEIDSRMDSRAARSADGIYFVMRYRVCVKRKPVAHKRQA